MTDRIKINYIRKESFANENWAVTKLGYDISELNIKQMYIKMFLNRLLS